MTDITVNLDALADDAKAWACVSAKLKELEGVVDRLQLDEADFMGFLHAAPDAAQAVADSLESLSTFLKDGAHKTLDGSRVLLEVREMYVDYEERARKMLHGLWEPDEKRGSE